MEIKITQGGVLDNSDISHKHLVYNHLTDSKVGWDQLIMYAEKRHMFTLLVSGLSSSNQKAMGHTPTKGDAAAIKTVVKPIPQGASTDNLYWKFGVMGKISRSTRFIRIIGTPTQGTPQRGGTFTMVVGDGTIKPQMNVLFPNGKFARVMGNPRVQANGECVCDLQCYAGDTFNEATWMLGKKTVFGSFSTVGERSRHGYSNFFFPDSYINHVTKQRKGFTLSGDAATQGIVWYETQGQKGFSYVAEVLARQAFLLEDEDQKWHGISTMRDQFGNLLDNSSMQDEKGEPIIAGDGYIEQIRGYNDFIASGSDGLPTADDLRDMVRALDTGRDHDNSEPWYVITGAPGMRKAAEIAAQLNQQSGITYTIQLDANNTEIGGQKVASGFNMVILNLDGKQLRFIENVQWNNAEKYPTIGASNISVMNSTFFFMDRSNLPNGNNAVEIRAREGNGRNRNLVYAWFEGMTGGPEKPIHPGDYIAFHMFKENMVCVYRPKANGIIRPNMQLI